MKIVTRALCLSIFLALGATSAACDNHKEEDAKREADEKAAEAARSAREAEAKAAAAKQEAEAQAMKAHAEAKANLQKEVDAADRKATYLKEKASKLTGAAKKNSEAALSELETRQASVKTSLAKLDNATGDAWAATKASVDSEIAAMNKAVDTLETTMKK